MPDSTRGLQLWAQRSGIDAAVLETFTVSPLPNNDSDCYDWCAVFVKDKRYMHNFKNRMINTLELPWVNGFKFYTPQGDWSAPMNMHAMFY